MSVTLHKYCCFGCVFLGATPIAQDAQYDNSDLSHLFFNVVRPESYQRHFGMVISFIYLPSLHMCPSQEHQQHYLSQTAQALWFSLKKRQQIIFLRKRGLNSQPALSRYICTFFFCAETTNHWEKEEEPGAFTEGLGEESVQSRPYFPMAA